MASSGWIDQSIQSCEGVREWRCEDGEGVEVWRREEKCEHRCHKSTFEITNYKLIRGSYLQND